MTRDDPLHNAHRCPRCSLPPRWCICEEQRPLSCALKVDVLMHDREAERPTSTGHLIQKVITDSQVHVWKAGHALDPGSLRRPERELWILHPNGEDLPSMLPPPHQVQVLLIDGSWKQATAMMKTVFGWGRRVRLPVNSASRYWLRNQPASGCLSTAEALLLLMKQFGLEENYAQFRLQFELHVYAVLCARGEKTEAAEYLRDSPIATAMPALVAKLNHCRKDYFH